MPLRIIFAGTSEFAVPSLEALLDVGYTVCAVYTQPDRLAGRGLQLSQSSVKEFALHCNLPIYQPETLRDVEEQEIMSALDADIMVDAAYGMFLPQDVLRMFEFGCINVHPSLLPRWRGAAPIQRSILAGDSETGVTIIQVDEGWDTGDVLKQVRVPLHVTDTTYSLTRSLGTLGAQLLLEVLQELEVGELIATPQDDKLSCYANKLAKQEAKIDWSFSAVQLDRMVRAFNPWPVVFAAIDDIVIRVWQTEVIEESSAAKLGMIVSADKSGIDVATGDGILRIVKLQLPGGKVLPVREVLNSKRDLFVVGARFNG